RKDAHHQTDITKRDHVLFIIPVATLNAGKSAPQSLQDPPRGHGRAGSCQGADRLPAQQADEKPRQLLTVRIPDALLLVTLDKGRISRRDLVEADAPGKVRWFSSQNTRPSWTTYN